MSKKVKVVALLKAKDGMTDAEIRNHWLNVHAKITGGYKNIKGYRVNLPLDGFSEENKALGYDGTAELWWDSVEDMNEDFASENGSKASADADSWVAECISFYSEEFIIL
ncbi:hypothetical protein AGMMS49983_16950 [Clostridia bacterium]|nr:hypothetical protein AGMMS49983_16950 [Clostridia bacterium]